LIATVEGGKARVLPNTEGSDLTPSVVAFAANGDVLVGEQARRQAIANPDRTVFSIKRHMGSQYKVKTDSREFTPEEISSLILRKAKADAEAHLRERIDRAVITVPAYFNDRQRQATRDAGEQAGLEVLRIISEPTAAALAYGLEREDAHTILVWDLGGGTFDVSVLELGDGIFEVLAVSGDSWLGGDDFDRRVMEWLADGYCERSGTRLALDGAVGECLREVGERAKILLSSCTDTQIDVPLSTVSRHHDFRTHLSREKFEGLTHDLLLRMVNPTRQALRDAGLETEQIDRVILVGGSTRMPAVRALAREVLGKEPYRYVDPDRVVAMGAAIHAAMLLGQIDKAVLLDVLPLSLGVETQGGLTARLIHRNTPLPASGSRIFTTARDLQQSMDIHVLQGERELATDNVSLGQFELSDIPRAPKGVIKVEVAFEADVDGILHVAARDLLTEEEVQVKLAAAKHLDTSEIEDLTRDAAANEAQDRKVRDLVQAKIRAENLLDAVEGTNDQASQPLARGIAHSVARLKSALKQGMAVEIERAISELRDLLAHSGPNEDVEALQETSAVR
jgi:molecular chaperone DnaK